MSHANKCGEKVNSSSAMYIIHNYKHSINPTGLERTQTHQHTVTLQYKHMWPQVNSKHPCKALSGGGTSRCGAHYAPDLRKDHLDK